MQRSAGDYTARKAYCVSTGSISCCPSKIVVDLSYNPTVDVSATVVVDPIINVDVSCNPQIDISLNQFVTIDVSFAPILDISNTNVIQVDVSFNPTIDVSCNPTVDISFNPSYTIDISFSPTIVYDVSDVAVTSTVVANPDAFGRARISNPYTLFEFTSILGKGDASEGQVIFDEDVSGTYSVSAWDPASYVTMDISGTGYVIRQSHEYIVYQPGKSKLIYMTAVLYQDTTADPTYTLTGLISRVGNFDASMGVYFECSGGTIAIVLRNNGVTDYVTQNLWNIDHLDGTGVSPTPVDFKKGQIFVIDFEWLGVGQVRCGIFQGGSLYYCHAFTHINTLTVPYFRTAKLPLRYEIRGTEATKNSMHMICGTVISEGGFTPQAMTKTFPTTLPNARWTLPNGVGGSEGVFVPLITIQIRSGYPSRYGTIKIKGLDLFCIDASRLGSWRLILNGTVTGTPVDYDTSGSIAQVINHAPGDTYSQTSGRVLTMDYWLSRTNSVLFTSTEELINAPPICYNSLNNTADRVTLVANTFATGGTSVVLANMQWIEIM